MNLLLMEEVPYRNNIEREIIFNDKFMEENLN